MKKFLLTVFTFILLLPQLALAQEINIGGFEISIALLTIIIFVLIILFLFIGIKGPKIGLPIGMILFALFLLIVFLFPSFSGITFNVPSDWRRFELPEIVVTIFEILGISRDWLWLPAFIYLVLIPFAVIFILVYAFLKELRLFPASPNLARTIAFLVTFLTIPFGLFAKFINVMFAVFLGFYAVLLFVAMFILSAFFLAYRGVSVAYGRVEIVRTITDELRRINSEIAKLERALKEAKPEDIPKIQETLAALRARRDVLRGELREEVK